MRDLFSEYGTVELVSIPKKPESGQPRGFAFVDMSSAEETQRVVGSLNGADVSGRKIRVQISLPKEQADKQNMQFGTYTICILSWVRLQTVSPLNLEQLMR